MVGGTVSSLVDDRTWGKVYGHRCVGLQGMPTLSLSERS
jgi:hypothetical protein